LKFIDRRLFVPTRRVCQVPRHFLNPASPTTPDRSEMNPGYWRGEPSWWGLKVPETPMSIPKKSRPEQNTKTTSLQLTHLYKARDFPYWDLITLELEHKIGRRLIEFYSGAFKLRFGQARVKWSVVRSIHFTGGSSLRGPLLGSSAVATNPFQTRAGCGQRK
jgi:hypothetical protein